MCTPSSARLSPVSGHLCAMLRGDAWCSYICGYNLIMEAIGLRELNQNPSRAVARVRAGMSLLVTDRGVPVLRMVPEVGQLTMLQRAVLDGKAQPPATAQMPDVIAELSELPGDLGDMIVGERDRERNR